MRGKLTRSFYFSMIFIVIVSSTINIMPSQTESVDSLFTLVFKTSSGGVYPDYGNFLKQHCARIGINIEVIIQDWPTFIGELIAYRNFDIAFVELTDDNNRVGNPDMTGVYNQDGSLNIFGYNINMDYNATLGTGKNEWYMRQGNIIVPSDSVERVNHYWDWQDYLMDEICPMLPVFSSTSYSASWSNLQGYNKSDGILQSWGKMNWNGLHEGQTNINEMVIADSPWINLNPLLHYDSASDYIIKQCLDPLIWYDSDGSLYPHLAINCTFINDNTVSIKLRDDIYWQDYDVFTDEPFDADDVYFTFYAWKYLSIDKSSYAWIKDIKKISDDQLYIYIDGKASTPEKDPFVPALNALAKVILPEHYLNQTQLGDGVTPDISHESWTNFSSNCFGTGLFTISDFEPGVETTLTVNPESWWVNSSITNDSVLGWEARFGDFVGGLTNQRIRIIPDVQTAISEFTVGKIDISDVSQVHDYRIQFDLDPTKSVQYGECYQLGFFGFNMRPNRAMIGSDEPAPNDPSITKGLAVRKALCYATDRNEINAVIHRGEYNITDYPLYQKLGNWCNPNIIRYNHDLDKAREYLTKVGNWYCPPPSDPPIWVTIAKITAVAISIGICIGVPIFIYNWRKKKN
ncbi:MAG: ABC transporter substrate-binding protein [Candidatus Heimdallarchaeota archaeon]